MAQPITLTMDGLILNWLKAVGEEVKAGEIIAEVEADKATVEVEAPADGVLVEISAEVGEELEEGAVIGQIGAADEAPSGSSNGNGSGSRSSSAATSQPEPASDQAEPAPASTSQNGNGSSANGAARTEDGRVKASPVARNVAEERGIDIAQVPGSGPGGRVVKADVLSFDPAQAPAQPQAAPAAQPAAAPAAAGPGQQATYGKLPQGDDVEMIDISRMRRRIADNTILSKQQIPHFYVTMGIDVAPMLALRKEINASLESEGIKVSVNDMIVKATALTLREFPNLNSHYYGDKVVRHRRVNVGIAVALPDNGLVNVVCHDADKRALSDIAQANAAMYARVRDGKIKPEDVQGATFTVSNLGPYDVDHFLAIISPPEAGIIAVGTAKKVPVVNEDGSVGVAQRMNVTISVDHRVSDGAEGADWLRTFKGLLENPMRLLI